MDLDTHTISEILDHVSSHDRERIRFDSSDNFYVDIVGLEEDLSELTFDFA